jgi:hypothetical protein
MLPVQASINFEKSRQRECRFATALGIAAAFETSQNSNREVEEAQERRTAPNMLLHQLYCAHCTETPMDTDPARSAPLSQFSCA